MDFELKIDRIDVKSTPMYAINLSLTDWEDARADAKSAIIQ